jgi:pSer/pThr/pTyr-binding forkhead associated (FHA) protein
MMSLGWVDDPYSEFLDLPPGARPPHYYGLLELEIFCAHREKIEHAARKQFRKIKPYQDHPERNMREAIQDVINQIAQAQVTLTDPEKKDAYDRELALKLGIDRERILASRMATPVPDYALIITAGPDSVGETIELLSDTKVTIGRDPHCLMALNALRVSKLHGELRYRDGRWTYVHVAKGGVSLVNRERITQQDLADDDRLQVGSYALRFRSIDKLRASSIPRRSPLSLIVTRGPSVPDAACNALAPETVVIGTAETALWQLVGERVSQHHCRISYESDRWSVVDLKSAEGTFLNGQPVAQAPLSQRDTLTIGSFEVTVSLRK